MKAIGPTYIQNEARDYQKYAGTRNRTTKDRQEDHPNDEENAGKQLLQQPNQGNQTEEILVTGKRRIKLFNKKCDSSLYQNIHQ